MINTLLPHDHPLTQTNTMTLSRNMFYLSAKQHNFWQVDITISVLYIRNIAVEITGRI